ncbi:MAG: ABC transporter substrate-binding protein [Eubacteriales bacterium]|nr:ABC transporter substrate-binding protein [Eubacteriales bacterium]
MEKRRDGRAGGTLRLAEMTPGFCHYLRFLNEAPLLETEDPAKWHHYSKTDGKVLPGIFEEFSADESGMRHTFSIRKGLLWSDGEPVTTEDVRYAVEDVLLLPELRKYLTNSENAKIMLPEWEWIHWGNEPVRLQIVDERRFTLIFSAPCYGFARMQVRSARWQMLLKPSHYLKQYHFRYAEREALAEKMRADGFDKESWDVYYHFIDPVIREAGYFVPERVPRIWDYPSLDPWIYDRRSTPEHYLLKRNPHFYQHDREGNRLPYIETVTRDFYPTREELSEAVVRGQCDVSGCFLKLNDPILENREVLERCAKIWLRPWQVQQVVFLINLCPEQAWMRPFVQDFRFRRALSLAIDRERMKEEMFCGDGTPSQIAPEPYRPYYDARFPVRNAEFDPELAGALLDEMGICFREGERDVRYFPNGEEASLELVYYLVTPMADEAVAFLKEGLRNIGIRLTVTRLKNGSEMGAYQVRNRHILTVWEMPGDDPFLPYQIGGLSDPCPLYWRWYETKGAEGVEPIPEVKELYRLREKLKGARTEEERFEAAKGLYELQSENLWVIGTVSGVRQPFLVDKKFVTGIKEGEATLYSALSSGKTWYVGEEQ